ncbi:MAG TPA: hypothetical protein VNO21_15205 [Polyangiaceae bacterium]|nr:hypothetical protein [Polyangiaceae bacterium]
MRTWDVTSSITRRRTFAVRALFVLVQALALMLAVQATGLPHWFADTFIADSSEHSTPGSDDDDKSCPPGCPTCHACGHTEAIFVPRGAMISIASHVFLPRSLGEPSRPRAPPPSSFFRPPRA